MSGQTPKAVGEAAGVCARTIRKWVSRYRSEGLAGLTSPVVRGLIGCIGRRLQWSSPRSNVSAANATLASVIAAELHISAATAVAFTAAIIAFATEYGRYRYRRIAAMLRDAGSVVNIKRVERISAAGGAEASAEATEERPAVAQ